MTSKPHTYSRRDFLRNIAAATAGLALVPRDVLSQASPSAARPYNFLVIGDSVISGQGLLETQKFYYLTKEWLEAEVFAGARKVELKVKAHSGANLSLKPTDAEGLKRAGIDETKEFPVEINIPFPSITTQIDQARKEYADPTTVDLIMLTGGITDVRVSTILDPFEKNRELRESIAAACNTKMSALLKHAAESFPNATIAVVGYYPMLSKHTPASKIINHVMELRDVASPLKPLINNVINRRLFRYYTNKMIRRSLIWAEDSTRELRKAVDGLNSAAGRQRAVFIESPIKEANSLGAKNTLLFELGKKGRATDPLATERGVVCREVLPDLGKSTGLKFDIVTCGIASIGHPNVAGAKATANAIKESLKKFF